MERKDFLENIAHRLGRTPLTAAPPRDLPGVPDDYRQHPYGQLESADRAARFQSELEALGGRAVIVDSPAAVTEALRAALEALSPEIVITWERREFQGWELDWLWDTAGAVSWAAGSSADTAEIVSLRATAQAADVGITLADFAVANTGTLVLLTTPSRARSVSLLPTVHIALVRESQLIDRMGPALEALSHAGAAGIPSSAHFISGPSRSADIENDLSIGVHGPAAVTVILLRNR